MTLLDQQSPEEHRQRYDALLARARARPTAQRIEPAPIAAAALRQRENVPGGWYWPMRLARGQRLRVVNTAGSSCVSLMAWSAADPSERLNVADTVKVQWTTRITTGHVLLSDMGRVLLSITADTCGRHDALVGGSTAATNARRYGRPGLRNTRDNLLLAAAKYGLSRRDVSPCFTLFARVGTDDAGHLLWQGAGAPGEAVDLRAEMDLLVVLSNCPHPLDDSPDYAPAAIEALVWDMPSAAADDPCRQAGEEAARAFARTDETTHG